jgi:hypothetical protein
VVPPIQPDQWWPLCQWIRSNVGSSSSTRHAGCRLWHLYTGGRPAECFRMRWDDISLPGADASPPVWVLNLAGILQLFQGMPGTGFCLVSSLGYGYSSWLCSFVFRLLGVGKENKKNITPMTPRSALKASFSFPFSPVGFQGSWWVASLVDVVAVLARRRLLRDRKGQKRKGKRESNLASKDILRLSPCCCWCCHR